MSYFFFSNFKGRDGKSILTLWCAMLHTASHCQTSVEQQKMQQLYFPNEQKANLNSSYSPAASLSDHICQWFFSSPPSPWSLGSISACTPRVRGLSPTALASADREEKSASGCAGHPLHGQKYFPPYTPLVPAEQQNTRANNPTHSTATVLNYYGRSLHFRSRSIASE